MNLCGCKLVGYFVLNPNAETPPARYRPYALARNATITSDACTNSVTIPSSKSVPSISDSDMMKPVMFDAYVTE